MDEARQLWLSLGYQLVVQPQPVYIFAQPSVSDGWIVMLVHSNGFIFEILEEYTGNTLLEALSQIKVEEWRK